MVNRSDDTGRKYSMEIKSQVMRVSRSNASLQIKVSNSELKDFDHFKYLGSVLFHKGNEKEMSMAKKAFNRKILLLTSKLKIELRQILVSCYVWSIAQ